MARLTLRLPESLHQRLVRQAQAEGVSMNQYLVYALTKATAAHSPTEQRARFDELRTRFSDDEAEAALAELSASRGG